MTQEEEPNFEELKKNTLDAIKKKLTGMSKAIKKAQDDYARSQEFEHVQHLAELLKSHFPKLQRGMEEIVLPDWKKDYEETKIALDPLASPQDMLQDMFTKSKKLQKAIEPLKALLEKFDKEFRRWHEAQVKAEGAQDVATLKALQEAFELFPKKSIKEEKKTLPYHHFRSATGQDIFVGKNAVSNEQVTFQIAHNNDLWLHAHGMSGAHVVVRKKEGHDVDPETLQDALQLALYYSKGRSKGDSCDVLVSERKYVSRLPHMPKGKVVVSKHKTVTVVLDKERIKEIIKRT
jgi:predicted ribosome quality control (RQC) complex YloA/Tae2 family protein